MRSGRFLSLVRDFVVFDDDGSGNLVKKMAGYHLFHAVRIALEETLPSLPCRHCSGTGRREVRIGKETWWGHW